MSRFFERVLLQSSPSGTTLQRGKIGRRHSSDMQALYYSYDRGACPSWISKAIE